MTAAEAAALHARALRAFANSDAAEAAALLTQALACAAPPPRCRADLAVIHASRQEWRLARDVLAPALADLDAQSVAVFLVASTLLGDSGQAVTALRDSGNRRWVYHLDARAEYGRACADSGRYAEAEQVLGAVVAEAPAHGRAIDALAHVCVARGRSDDAIDHWQARVEQAPADASRHVDLAMGLLKVGRVEQAAAARERAEQLDPAGESLAQALYLHLFDQRSTAATVRAAHERAGTAASAGRRRARRSGGGRVRVGFLSGEFDSRPATFFLTPLLSSLDRDRCTVVRYNTSLRTLAGVPAAHPNDLWRNLPGGDDDALRLIDGDRIDVLVDLAGCFPGQRRGLLTRGAAPVQAAYPNYPGTTGIAAVQWFLTDRWLTPTGSEDGYSEGVYRLPGGALRFAPPPSPPLATRDTTRRPISFGLFQRAVKYSAATWDLVSGALRAVPGARLLVHSSDVELDLPGSPLRRRIDSQLAARDVDPSRVRLVGGRHLQAHLAVVGSVDIALDTYPFSGQTTAMECLWMGVPIVCRRGSLHASRVSAALMAQVGLEACVGDDEAGYVRAAGRLADDLPGLRAMQRELRSRLIDAGLTDGARLAREVEDALEGWVVTSSAPPATGGTAGSA